MYVHTDLNILTPCVKHVHGTHCVSWVLYIRWWKVNHHTHTHTNTYNSGRCMTGERVVSGCLSKHRDLLVSLSSIVDASIYVHMHLVAKLKHHHIHYQKEMQTFQQRVCFTTNLFMCVIWGTSDLVLALR